MDIDYEVVRSATRKKSAVLKVLPDGTVQVRAPVKMSSMFIEQFVEKNYQWIQQQVAKSVRQKRNEVADGKLWPYLGEVYPMKIISTRLRPRVSLENGYLWVRTNGKLDKSMLRKLVLQWYKKQARELIVKLVKIHAEKIDRKFGTIRLKDTTSRWGSCSSEGNLNFNWRLVLAPERVLEYVVIHEICHLVHQHHKPSFWRLVESIDREYRTSRTYLKHHGWKLQV